MELRYFKALKLLEFVDESVLDEIDINRPVQVLGQKLSNLFHANPALIRSILNALHMVPPENLEMVVTHLLEILKHEQGKDPVEIHREVVSAIRNAMGGMQECDSVEGNGHPEVETPFNIHPKLPARN